VWIIRAVDAGDGRGGEVPAHGGHPACHPWLALEVGDALPGQGETVAQVEDVADEVRRRDVTRLTGQRDLAERVVADGRGPLAAEPAEVVLPGPRGAAGRLSRVVAVQVGPVGEHEHLLDLGLPAHADRAGRGGERLSRVEVVKLRPLHVRMISNLCSIRNSVQRTVWRLAPVVPSPVRPRDILR
jgi:hypothetical protein